VVRASTVSPETFCTPRRNRRTAAAPCRQRTGRSGQRLGATVTATTVLVCVKAAATVSVTWATAASVAAAPFLRGLGGNGDEGLL
jgi:hypothetical protein